MGEFTAAFAIGYDWLYSYWTDTRRTSLRSSIIDFGLKYGVQAYNDPNSGFGWWRTVNGNWNCVCNSGLAMGALAILGDDTTGTAGDILDLVVGPGRSVVVDTADGLPCRAWTACSPVRVPGRAFRQ